MLSLRDKQKLQTRMEIVKTGFDLFGRHGYESVSVEMICEAVGISRATFFNYFPQKDLLLGEMAKARFEKVRSYIAKFAERGKRPGFDDLVTLFVRISEENGRLSAGSKPLLLQTLLGAASRGELIATRNKAIDTIAAAVGNRLAAETFFAVYIATTLEWLLQDKLPVKWLVGSVRKRLQLVLDGIR